MLDQCTHMHMHFYPDSSCSAIISIVCSICSKNSMLVPAMPFNSDLSECDVSTVTNMYRACIEHVSDVLWCDILYADTLRDV